MWLGRGDFDRQDWIQCLQQACDTRDERLTTYAVETPLLADYLANATAELGGPVEEHGGLVS
jgi:hypothetical protein